MKSKDSIIRVGTGDQGFPFKILHDGYLQEVKEILERWADSGEWWKGESEKMFYRLQLGLGQVMEIYQDLVTGEWHIYKVYD